MKLNIALNLLFTTRATATVSIEPGIRGVGIGWMYTILGLLLVVSNVLLPILLKFGPKWRQNRVVKQLQKDSKCKNKIKKIET